jgi:Domain of unknown function (DUF4189)
MVCRHLPSRGRNNRGQNFGNARRRRTSRPPPDKKMAETEITASEPGAIIRGQVTAGRPLRQRTLFTRIQGASQNYPIESLRSATTMILAAVIAQTGVSLAAGAIAVGVPPDVAKQGISMGFSTNRDTMDHAKARSMTLCKISGSLISGILCQVVATFENKCVAVAIDPQVQTSGFGWAVADTEQASKNNALFKCNATAGPNRENACKITDSYCDRSAKSN